MTLSWHAGDEIGARYRLVEPLATGGGGELWRAEHIALRSRVAIKFLGRDLVGNADMEARFRREAQAVAALSNPHIVRVLDAGVHEAVPFIAMELLEGESLRDRVRRVGAMPFGDTKRIFSEICRGVAHAHACGVVHRDLKPANIFLSRENDEECVKVLDFGVAKVTNSLAAASVKTRTGDMLGTPFYMSPEQLRGAKNIDHRTDVWSLGVIAYQCLVGTRPFEAKTLGDLVMLVCVDEPPIPSEHGNVPAGFDSWFKTATTRRPAERFASCDAMIAAFDALA